MRIAPEEIQAIQKRILRLKAREAELRNLMTRSHSSLQSTSEYEATLVAVSGELAELELELRSRQPQ